MLDKDSHSGTRKLITRAVINRFKIRITIYIIFYTQMRYNYNMLKCLKEYLKNSKIKPKNKFVYKTAEIIQNVIYSNNFLKKLN